jgi:hypothetical protein
MYRFVLGTSVGLATLLGVVVVPAYAAPATPIPHPGVIPHRHISATDNCDPISFNATVGPGTCVGNGRGLEFSFFINQVQTRHEESAWHFSPRH